MYYNGIRPANGVDIFNMESGMMVSQSRCDMRKFRKTKEEKDLVREAIRIGNLMKKAWEKSAWHPEGMRKQPDFYYHEPETNQENQTRTPPDART